MKRIISLILCAILGIHIQLADNCELHIAVVTPDEEFCGGETAVANILKSRLIRALNASGVSAGENYGQLYLTGRFDDTYKETVPGPPAKVAVATNLTIMVADIFDKKVFDSETFEIKGVGTSAERAYINALNSISGKNRGLMDLIDRTQRRIVSYFDSNYQSILTRARKAADTENYEEALYLASLIPECSRGYEAARKALMTYYQSYVDCEGKDLLNKAKAEFAVSPNAEGAERAYALISQISQKSSSYAAALSFAKEVAAQTKKEYDFEVHKKYEDAHSIDVQEINAARDIGVAWGRGQKNNTTNILWK